MGKSKSKIYAGLDIGTSKICMVVGEVNPDDSMTILGMGEVPSNGVVHGEIEDSAAVLDCLREAWELAQSHADTDIMTVQLAVTGEHITGDTNWGQLRLDDSESIITADHIEEVKRQAQEYALDQDQSVLHRVIGSFCVDEMPGVEYPEGEVAQTLDVSCLIIHGKRARIRRTVLPVLNIPLAVEDVIFAPVAGAQFVMDRKTREQGALHLDIGAGTTDYVLYLGKQMVACGCIPVGGDDITAEIARNLGVSMAEAERIKITEGYALQASMRGSGDMVVATRPNGSKVQVKRQDITALIQQKLAEALIRVRNKLPDVGFSRPLDKHLADMMLAGAFSQETASRANSERGTASGPSVEEENARKNDELKRRDARYFGTRCTNVLLTGGVSQTRGLGSLAAWIFEDCDIYAYSPENQEKETDQTIKYGSYLENPSYVTAIGLLRYAQIRGESQPRTTGLWSRFKRLFFGRGK